jgi:exonuclease I
LNTEVEIDDNYVYRLFFDVEFPQNIPVTIRVRYHNFVDPYAYMARGRISYGLDGSYGEPPYCWNGPAEYTVVLENRSRDFFWITGILGIMPQKNLLDEDLAKLGVEYTVIGENITSLRLTPLIQNKNRRVRIDLSTVFHGYSGDNLLFDYIPHHANDDNGIKVSKQIVNPYKLLLLTSGQLRILRNAFYAQYGYVFQDPELRDLFQEIPEKADKPIQDAKSSTFSDSLINPVERENIRIIRELESLKNAALP